MKFKITQVYIVVAVVAIQMVATASFSQTLSLRFVPKINKNLISFVISEHSFFDGHKMFAVRSATNAGGYKPFIMGVEYLRRINDMWNIQGSARFCNHYYWDANDFGDVSGRYAFFFEVNMLRRLWSRNGFSIHALGGALFRTGGENVLANRYFGERLHNLYRLRDPGLTIGCRVQYELYESVDIPVVENLVIASEAKFSQVLWRFNSSLPNRVFYANRSTTQMFSLQLGLGYQF